MLLQLEPDQEFLHETTARFLREHVPVNRLRDLRHDPVGYDDAYWRAGAELGWTSLLVSEEHGGGTVSGHGLVDLSLLAYEFGFQAAPGPLLPNNVVASVLSNEPGAPHADLLPGLLDGSTRAAWCYSEPPPHDRLGDVTLDIRVDGGDVVLSGVKRPVEGAAHADVLLVTGRTGDGLTQVLVPAGTAGVDVRTMKGVDLTRRFAAVNFDEVRVPASAVVGDVGGAGDEVERQLRVALCILNAESVGAMQRAFDMTLEWLFDRYSFGRPLGSYQAIKHRAADIKTWLEASHAVADAATMAVDEGKGDVDELLSSAKAFIGEYGSELLQECVQFHGGIGVTFEHDVHLFLRRHTVNRALFGTPNEHHRRLTDLLEQKKEAA